MFWRCVTVWVTASLNIGGSVHSAICTETTVAWSSAVKTLSSRSCMSAAIVIRSLKNS